MILTCNSCSKKFVVPDTAITSSGRMVQCGSCGNKWRQFPLNKMQKEETAYVPKKIVTKPRPVIQKTEKVKKKTIKKTREISLYSPEYLAKKHGIKINETVSKKTEIKRKNSKVSFGFYSSLLIFFVTIIFFSRTLYFSQEFIIDLFPNTEYYLNYFFENMKNIFEIWKDLISSY